MARKNNQPLRPTDGGLEVLRVLWDRGPSTVRQVHETLARSKAITFNTTRMRIVHGKGLLARVRRLLGEPSGERSRSGWLPGFVILVSILVAVLAAQTGAGNERPEQPSKQSVEPSQQVKSARIAQLIDQLGSEPHDQREKAQQELAKIGIPAIAALVKASSAEDPERAKRARTALRQIEEAAWGKPSQGLQVRLRPFRSVWRAGQTPSLFLDVRNRGKRPIRLFPAAHIHCQIELDGRWYTWLGAIAISGPGWPVEPGREWLRAIPVKLTDSWARLNGGTLRRDQSLKLSSGKHTVRVRFRPLDGQPVCLSNPVEMQIKRPTAHAPAATRPGSSQTQPAAK